MVYCVSKKSDRKLHAPHAPPPPHTPKKLHPKGIIEMLKSPSLKAQNIF